MLTSQLFAGPYSNSAAMFNMMTQMVQATLVDDQDEKSLSNETKILHFLEGCKSSTSNLEGLEPPRKKARISSTLAGQNGDPEDSVIMKVSVIDVISDIHSDVSAEVDGVTPILLYNEIIPNIKLEEKDIKTFTLTMTSLQTESFCSLDLYSDDLAILLEDYRHVLKSKGAIRRPFSSTATIGPIFFACKLLFPVPGSLLAFRIQIKTLWRTEKHSLDRQTRLNRHLQQIMSKSFPQELDQRPASWSPQTFYQSVHVPQKSKIVPSNIQSSRMTCKLYPFQKRAAAWMLEREGVYLADDGEVVRRASKNSRLPLSFSEEKDAESGSCFVSHLFSVVTRDLRELELYTPELQGGLLAEEMGKSFER